MTQPDQFPPAQKTTVVSSQGQQPEPANSLIQVAFGFSIVGFFILPVVFTLASMVMVFVWRGQKKARPQMGGGGLATAAGILNAISWLYFWFVGRHM